jgi:predicted DsbA family dithiol-disulfide isomerase
MASMDKTSVDFWMDPLCPWSWLTARWLHEVQEQGRVDVTWHVMSLAILNEGQELPEEWRDFPGQSWQVSRATQAVLNEAPASYVPFVMALGTRWHSEGRRDLDAILAEAAAECGLPEAVVAVASTDALDEEVRLSHKQAVFLGGPDVGSPILGFHREDGEQVGFYGPVVSRVPTGEEAVRLFDATQTLATTSGFFELKRTRDEEPWLL